MTAAGSFEAQRIEPIEVEKMLGQIGFCRYALACAVSRRVIYRLAFQRSAICELDACLGTDLAREFPAAYRLIYQARQSAYSAGCTDLFSARPSDAKQFAMAAIDDLKRAADSIREQMEAMC